MINLSIHGDTTIIANLDKQILLMNFKEYKLEKTDQMLTFSFTKENDNQFTVSIVGAILDYIANVAEWDIIRDILFTEYGDMFGEDEDWLISKIHQQLHSQGYYETIRGDLTDILSVDLTERNFDISGFMIFRLHDHIIDVYNTVLTMAENYLLSSDDLQFIKALHRLVAIQIPKTEFLDLILIGNEFRIMINGDQLIDPNDLKNLLIELNQQNSYVLTDEDIILSTIITLAPRQIKVHHSAGNTPPLIDVLEKVYENRMTLCENCELCALFRNPQ